MSDRCWGGGADGPLEGGGGMTDPWSLALEKRAARRGGGGGGVRLSAKARAALAGREADKPLQGGGGGLGWGGVTDVRGGGEGGGSLKKRAAWRRVRLSAKAHVAVAEGGGA